MTVLIYTSEEDIAATHVTEYLRSRGVEVCRLDSEQVPHKIFLSNQNNQSGQHLFSINSPGQQIHSGNIRSIWYRKHLEPTFARTLDMTSRRFFNAEASHVMEALWFMSDCYWMNHPSYMRMAANKLEQLNRASKMGFSIPETLVTSSYEEFIAFYERHSCRVLVKILSKLFVESSSAEEGKEHPFSSVESPGAIKSAITMAIGPRELDIIRSTPLVYPHQFQQYVAKTHDLKVVVVGKRVFALKSHAISEQDNEDVNAGLLSEVDWQAYSLPREVESKVLEYTESYRLSYSVIDLVLRANGEHVFIKMNPSDTFFHRVFLDNGQIAHIAECLLSKKSLPNLAAVGQGSKKEFVDG